MAQFIGTDAADSYAEDAANDSLVGNRGDDTLTGGGGADYIEGDDGADVLASAGITSVGQGSAVVRTESSDLGAEQDTLLGGAGDDRLYAGFNDNVDGGDGIDILSLNIAGASSGVRVDFNDLLSGRSTSAQVGGGTIANIEGVSVLNGSAFDDRLLLFIYNGAEPKFDAHTSIYGGGGSDTILAGRGIDLVDGGDGNDDINAISGMILGGAGADTLTISTGYADGGDGDDRFTIYGVTNTAGPTLVGGAGNDSFSNQNSTSTYLVRIDGGTGNDSMASSGYADTLIGGVGDDRYSGVGASTVIVENPGEGNDELVVRVTGDNAVSSYALSQNLSIESLNVGYDPNAFYTPATSVVLIGNQYVQRIVADDGNNVLNGNGGADTLVGLRGDDIYVISSATAPGLVVEAAGEGNDTVFTRVSYALPANASVETLSFADQRGTEGYGLSGNAFAQRIIGNSGNNSFNGLGGADTLIGLKGNDVYQIDDTSAVIVEAPGEGYDTVYVSGSYALTGTAEIEYLALTSQRGTENFNLIGNQFAQQIIGNFGNNVLNGNGGADTLGGTRGDDIYVVNDPRAVVNEVDFADQGNDTVYVNTSYALAAGSSVETLSTATQRGTEAYDLTGNELSQTVVGNNGANVLDGGAGADVLIGLGDADTFRFSSALGQSNVDRIADYGNGADRIELARGVFTGLAAGTLAASAFTAGTTASGTAAQIVYDQATGNLSYDADGTGSGAAVLFATVAPGTILTAGAFTVT